MLVDLASKTGLPFRVFTLDTGRLHSETYHFIDRVRERYNVPIDVYFPEPEAVEKLVREKGMFSFYRDGHKECCTIRKVKPLKRALGGLKAWITGQRRDQRPGNAHRGARRPTGPRICFERPRAGQVQSAGSLEFQAGLGLYSRE